MKTQTKKLELKKHTIVELNSIEMLSIKGGTQTWETWSRLVTSVFCSISAPPVRTDSE